jgi:hypothetical protein
MRQITTSSQSYWNLFFNTEWKENGRTRFLIELGTFFQNYWVLGLGPLPGIVQTRKHNIQESGLVSLKEETSTLLGPLERANLNHNQKCSVLYFPEYRTMNEVKKQVILSVTDHDQNHSESIELSISMVWYDLIYQLDYRNKIYIQKRSLTADHTSPHPQMLTFPTPHLSFCKSSITNNSLKYWTTSLLQRSEETRSYSGATYLPPEKLCVAQMHNSFSLITVPFCNF